jgi:hypothetical protein
MAGNSGSGTTPTTKEPSSAPSNLTSGGGGQSEQNRLAGMVSQAPSSLPSPQTAPAAPTGFDPSMAATYNQNSAGVAPPAPKPPAAPDAGGSTNYTAPTALTPINTKPPPPTSPYQSYTGAAGLVGNKGAFK